MFDIGFFELLLIGIVGLLILGPERLPVAARTAGLWIGKIRRSVSNVQREISSQLEAEELRQKVAEQQTKLDNGVNQVRRGVENTFSSSSQRGDSSPTATSSSEVPSTSSTASPAAVSTSESPPGHDTRESVDDGGTHAADAPPSPIPQPTSGTDRHAPAAESPTEDKDHRDR
ncbi:Sec-independent protein translocase protein TatB [Salinicola aestuarinus]|uniref:Sec-independent protein translocase protein TatB n=1 Tax=Salinicola aestuarinus TaxID=1949082 RepID=UPI000DA238AE|nr:Sec-independent protein translocase protein TatB [Salinicola aestuarinus]